MSIDSLNFTYKNLVGLCESRGFFSKQPGKHVTHLLVCLPNRKLSLGSRQTFALLVPATNSALKLFCCIESCKSAIEKYLLNYGRMAISENSSISSWLKSKISDWSEKILSCFEKSFFVIKKFIQRLESMICRWKNVKY
jgi:hypothetical protein